MNRVLVVFSDGLLSELDSARHETPRSAWIRRAVEERLAKEAVAPLVPEDGFPTGVVHFPSVWTEETEEALKGAWEKQEPKPKARRKKSVKDSPTAISVEDGGDRDAARKGQIPSKSPSLPARCNQEPLKESK